MIRKLLNRLPWRAEVNQSLYELAAELREERNMTSSILRNNSVIKEIRADVEELTRNVVTLRKELEQAREGNEELRKMASHSQGVIRKFKCVLTGERY